MSVSPTPVREGEDFVLDASASSDPDGDTLSFEYVVEYDPGTQLVATASSSTTLTANDVDADRTATARVTVSDGSLTDTAEITFQVVNNQAPVAALRTLDGDVAVDTFREGDTVTFDASESTDPESDALSFTYRAVSGLDLDLSSLSGPQPTLVLPSVDEDTTLVVEVTATDGRDVSTAQTQLTIANNNAPLIEIVVSDAENMSADTFREGESITLDASLATDFEDDPIVISLVQIAGPDIDLPDVGTEVFTFDAPEVDADAVLTIEVQADDGRDVSTERVDLTIENTVLTPVFSPEFGVEQSLTVEGTITDLANVAYEAEAGVIATVDGGVLTLRDLRLNPNGIIEGGDPILTETFAANSFIGGSLAAPLLVLEQTGQLGDLNFIETSGSFTNPNFSVVGSVSVPELLAFADGPRVVNNKGSLFIASTDRITLYSYPTGGPFRQSAQDSLNGFTREASINGRSYSVLDAGFSSSTMASPAGNVVALGYNDDVLKQMQVISGLPPQYWSTLRVRVFGYFALEGARYGEKTLHT